MRGVIFGVEDGEGRDRGDLRRNWVREEKRRIGGGKGGRCIELRCWLVCFDRLIPDGFPQVRPGKRAPP